MSDAPERIYLQYVEGDDEFWSDTTWCVEKINDDDIPYIREPEPCVWRRSTTIQHGIATTTFIPSCPEFGDTLFPHCDEPEGRYCPYCGAEIEEDEA